MANIKKQINQLSIQKTYQDEHVIFSLVMITFLLLHHYQMIPKKAESFSIKFENYVIYVTLHLIRFPVTLFHCRYCFHCHFQYYDLEIQNQSLVNEKITEKRKKKKNKNGTKISCIKKQHSPIKLCKYYQKTRTLTYQLNLKQKVRFV